MTFLQGASSDRSTSSAHNTALNFITLIGCGLSIIGLLATIGVHGFVAKLRATVPSKMLINLCVALLLGLVLFILASYAQGDTATCRVWAIGMHYFWLAALVWMVMEGANLYAVVVIVLGLKMEARYKVYCALAWGEYHGVAILVFEMIFIVAYVSLHCEDRVLAYASVA